MPTALHFKAWLDYQLVSMLQWVSSLLIDPFLINVERGRLYLCPVCLSSLSVITVSNSSSPSCKLSAVSCRQVDYFWYSSVQNRTYVCWRLSGFINQAVFICKLLSFNSHKCAWDITQLFSFWYLYFIFEAFTSFHSNRHMWISNYLLFKI